MQADAFVSNAVNRIGRAIATNPRFAEGERVSIKKEMDLLPALLRSENAFVNRLLGIDLLLERLERDAYSGSEDKSITVDERNIAANDLRIIRNTRDLLGVRDLPVVNPRTPDLATKTFSGLSIGQRYKYIDPDTGLSTVLKKAKP